MSIIPKDWAQFQHYKNRRPPWIKLYRNLLDDPVFCRLPVASRALAPMLWLLASDYQDGTIPMTVGDVAFRLRMTTDEFIEAFNPLISAGLFQCASIVLAPCQQLAIPETEREGERETEKDTSASKMLAEYVVVRGKVKLTQKTIDDWQSAFPEINVRSEIEAAYEWAASQKNWFLSLKGLMGKRNREMMIQKQAVKLGMATASTARKTGGGFA